MALYSYYTQLQHQLQLSESLHASTSSANTIRSRKPSQASKNPATTSSIDPASLPAAMPQSQSLLLQLPAEIRNKIYKYLLGDGTCARTKPCSQPAPSELHPAILSTCRRVACEATPILYSHTFVASPSKLLTSLPSYYNPHAYNNRNAPRLVYSNRLLPLISRWKIRIRLDIDAHFTSADVARAFSGCDELEVEAWEAQFEACDYSVLRLFEEVRGVRKACVVGSVERGFADWLEMVMMSPMDDESDSESGGSGCNTPAYVELEGEDGRRFAAGPAGRLLWALG